MEVSKTASQGASTPGASTPGAPTSKSGLGAQAAPNIAAPDRANIRPLDIQAALQILLAEVRAAFDLQALSMSGDGSVVLDDTAQAAHAVIEILVQSMPDAAAPAVLWSAALARADTALPIGLARGVDAVSAWRDVSSSVVDAANETRSFVLSLFVDELQNPIWLRPEWLGLAPRFETMRRRRRRMRKAVSDPDYSQGRSHDSDEPR
jgi:hypothetical protein